MDLDRFTRDRVGDEPSGCSPNRDRPSCGRGSGDVMNMIKGHRSHQSYIAFLGLRLSGIALALFLPFHFLMLGLALEGANTMDRYLTMTNVLLIKIAEWALVTFLALHLFFGIRLLVLELLPWPTPQDVRKSWIPVAGGAAIIVGIIFLVRAL